MGSEVRQTEKLMSIFRFAAYAIVNFFIIFLCILLSLDIDECTSHPCDKKTENCHNTPGTYKCQCKKGFVRTKAGDCKKKTKNTKTKKKKKSPTEQGTKKKATWKDKLYDDILSGKAFEREENFRKFLYGHALVAALLLVMYKHRSFNLMAVLCAVYAVVVSYVYANYRKEIFYS